MKNKILIIEDEIRLAQLLYIELKHEGYEAEIAADGSAGLERIREQNFFAVLLDFMLPGMNGVDICRKTRTFSDVPIIALTARDDMCSALIQAGADQCFLKPCNIQQIFDFLEELPDKIGL